MPSHLNYDILPAAIIIMLNVSYWVLFVYLQLSMWIWNLNLGNTFIFHYILENNRKQTLC